MEVFANSEIGKVRSIEIYIVSDGMGGYNGGEIASRLRNSCS